MKCEKCGSKMNFFGVNGNSGDKYHCPKCYNMAVEKNSGFKREAGSESEQPPKKIKVKKDIETQEHNLC